MKNLKTALVISTLLAAGAAQAGGHAGAPMAADAKKPSASADAGMKKDMPMAAGDAKKDMPAMASADMAEGEIRKVDKATKKVTIKHGEIKNLDMPGMTMVFQVKDAAMLDQIKKGDKVRFKAEKSNGAIVVTDIQAAK